MPREALLHLCLLRRGALLRNPALLEGTRMHLHQRHGEHCHDAQPGREDRDPLLSLDEAAQVDIKEDVFEQVEGFPEISPPAPNANHRIHSVNWWVVQKQLLRCLASLS